MFSDTTLIMINVACICFLIIMLGILAAATKMKGGAGWVGLIIVTTTVPIYMANLTRDLSSDYFMFYAYPSVFLNALCFPATWFFTRRQLDKSFRLTAKSLLHALPAVISLASMVIFYAPMSSEEIEAEREFMESDSENLPAIINDVIVFGQFFIYFAAIFFYCRKRLKFLRNNYSDSDYMEIRWTPRFLLLFFVLFFIVTVAYVISPRTDTWLIPILNSVAMVYLVFIVIRHSTAAYLNRLPDMPTAAPEPQGATVPAMSEAQMKEICDRVTEYLQTSKAYSNPEFSLPMLSVETGISTNNISRSINGYLDKSFFDLVNGMRIEEAKRLLAGLDAEYTVESIYPDCGFSSARSFFRAFQKFEGVSPDRWRKDNAHYITQK